MSRTMGIFHFCNLDVPQQIAANFSERLLTIAANFFGMVDASTTATHILALAHMQTGLTAQTLRIVGRLSMYSNARPDIPRWMLH